jgi:hypothetical protein
MQKSIPNAVEANIFGIGLPDLVMHAPPNIVGVVAFDNPHRFAEDDCSLVGTVFLEQAEDDIPYGRLPYFFSHGCSSLSAS